MSVSTHVLDSVAGRPAAGIAVRLLAGEDLLAELRRRLGNPPEEERAEVTEQLAQITGLRVKGIVEP